MHPAEPHGAPAPSPPVAEAMLRHIAELQRVRSERGEAVMIVEALAMHGAALTMLRPTIGVGLVERLLDQALDDNDRIEARDRRIRRERERSRRAQDRGPTR